MKFNKRRASNIFLIIGIAFLAVGIATNNTAFSWTAVVFVVLSLLLGGRWLRPRKK
jgi:hypothetical protein